MGLQNALGFAEADVDIETALGWHLQCNHYPPVPAIMVEPCKAAIDAYWEDDCNREIAMPEGVSYKGKTEAPAWAIIEQHHLGAWTTDHDYDAEDDTPSE
jgi:hypothetical protein